MARISAAASRISWLAMAVPGYKWCRGVYVRDRGPAMLPSRLDGLHDLGTGGREGRPYDQVASSSFGPRKKGLKA